MGGLPTSRDLRAPPVPGKGNGNGRRRFSDPLEELTWHYVHPDEVGHLLIARMIAEQLPKLLASSLRGGAAAGAAEGGEPAPHGPLAAGRLPAPSHLDVASAAAISGRHRAPFMLKPTPSVLTAIFSQLPLKCSRPSATASGDTPTN